MKIPNTDRWNDETIKSCDIDHTIKRVLKKGNYMFILCARIDILQKLNKL